MASRYCPAAPRLSARNSVYLNYKNMPLAQLILNFLPLALGWCIKSLFFTKIGFGKDYRDGLREGFRTMKAQKKVPFRIRHLGNYVQIELELIAYTFAYARDWFSRKLFSK